MDKTGATAYQSVSHNWPASAEGIYVCRALAEGLPHLEALLALGTDPPWQRRGIGSALLQPVLQRCDAAHTAAYLETPSEAIVPFYERHGFRVREVIQLPWAR